MGLFDGFKNLTSLVQINLKLDLSQLKTIQIASNNQYKSGNKVSFDQRKQELTVNVDELSDLESSDLKAFIKQEVEKLNGLVLETKSSKLLEEISAIEEDSEVNSLLRFFDGKLPPADQLALETSLVLRQRKENGQDVRKDLEDLSARFGKRGKVIANLCSERYFEQYFRPMYEQMEKEPGFVNAHFLENWDLILTHLPFAAFISNNFSQTETTDHIREKLERSQKYGFYFVNIHGLGHENVAKIERSIQELEKTYSFEKSGKFGRSYIMVRLSLRRDTR